MRFQCLAIALTASLFAGHAAEAAPHWDWDMGLKAGLHHAAGLRGGFLGAILRNDGGAQWAQREGFLRNSIANYPSAPLSVPDDQPPSAYPISYTEEVAQRLGLGNGHMDLISLPAFHGGGSFGLGLGGFGSRPMLNLRWRIGP